MICMVCIGVAYARYISADLPLNAQLISDENSDLIVKNRQKLIDSGKFRLISEDNKYQAQTLQYIDNGNGNERVFFALHCFSVKPTFREGSTNAHYQRSGLIDALYGIGDFFQCTTTITVAEASCWIEAKFFHTDGTTKTFDRIMHEILDTVTK